VRYSIEQYDANGFLKAPKWLWLVMAGASRDSGPKILGLIYPDHSMLYLGLAMGVPSIAMMWLVGLRHPDRRWAIFSERLF